MKVSLSTQPSQLRIQNQAFTCFSCGSKVEHEKEVIVFLFIQRDSVTAPLKT